MSADKSRLEPATAEAEGHSSNGHHTLGSTSEDRRQMHRMGLVQQTRRTFSTWSLIGFVSSVMMSPQMAWNTMPYTLWDGGFGSFFWGLIVALPTFAFTYGSVAELAAMIPAAGGQLQWISELAPPRWQKVFSYIQGVYRIEELMLGRNADQDMSGWVLMLGWQAYVALVCFTCASGIMGLSSALYDFTPEPYQITLTTFCLAISAGLINTRCAIQLPALEIIAGVSHVLGPPAFLITFLVLSPRFNSAHEAFLSFSNIGGWNRPSIAAIIGMYLQVSLFVGYDCVVHMSEEIQSASNTVPRVLSWAFAVNFILMLMTNLTFMFCITDAGHILNTPTGIPYIQLFMDVTRSRAGGAICVIKILADIAFAGVSEQACASRQLWAFARTNGVPFSPYLKHVPKRMKVPVASIWATVACTCVLSLINLGSPLALNALISLGGTAVITSYVFSISCLLFRRRSSVPLPDESKAFLGRYGAAVNVGALLLLSPLLVFVNLPLFDHPDAAGLNWSPVLFGGVSILALLYYVVWGNKNYESPLNSIVSSMDESSIDRPKNATSK